MEGNLTSHLLLAAVVVAAFVLLSAPVHALLGYAARHFARSSKGALAAAIMETVRGSITPLMTVAGLTIALRAIRRAVGPAESALAEVLEYADGLLYTGVVLVVVRLLVATIRGTIHWYLDRVSGEGTSSLKLTLGPLTTKAANIGVALIAVIVILDHFGINIGSLLVSLGVGSLAVALAAQDTLANIIAGFVILVDRPFRVGDRIELATGQVGDVLEIGLRSTKMLNVDNNTIIIPNAELVRSRIMNYSYPHLPIRMLLKFDVAMGTDPARIRQLLLDLARKNSDLLPDPPPQVSLGSVGEYSVQFVLEARCAGFERQASAQTTLREQAYNEFLKQGIAMPVPARFVTTRTGS